MKKIRIHSTRNETHEYEKIIRHKSQKPEKLDLYKPAISLVVPPSPHITTPGWEFTLTIPLEGLTSIGTVLQNAGYKVDIIDVRISDNPLEESMEKLLRNADIVGITTFTDSFPFLEKFTKLIKQKRNDLLIILGGPLVSSIPNLVMKNSNADIAVLGEGELTILDLLDTLTKNKRNDALYKVAGICYKDRSERLIYTKKRPQIKNLDNLPISNFSLWPQVQKNPFLEKLLYSTHRGCIWNCSYCFKTIQKLRLKSSRRVKEEIRYFKSVHHTNFIAFNDLTFNYSNKRINSICEILKECDIKWACMARAQNFSVDLLRKMKDSGCETIWYGIESIDQKVLEQNKDGITVDEIKETVYNTENVGIQVIGTFIVGLPEETTESLEQTVQFIRERNLIPRVHYLSILPGTKIYKDAIKKELIVDELSHLYLQSLRRTTENDKFINCTRLSELKLRNAFNKIVKITKKRTKVK